MCCVGIDELTGRCRALAGCAPGTCTGASSGSQGSFPFPNNGNCGRCDPSAPNYACSVPVYFCGNALAWDCTQQACVGAHLPRRAGVRALVTRTLMWVRRPPASAGSACVSSSYGYVLTLVVALFTLAYEALQTALGTCAWAQYLPAWLGCLKCLCEGAGRCGVCLFFLVGVALAGGGVGFAVEMHSLGTVFVSFAISRVQGWAVWFLTRSASAARDERSVHALHA